MPTITCGSWRGPVASAERAEASVRNPCCGQAAREAASATRRELLPPPRSLAVALSRLHPARLPVSTRLFLPEGRPRLEVVHQELGGSKGRLAVRRGRHHQYDVVSGFERADAMHDEACLERPAFPRFGLHA